MYSDNPNRIETVYHSHKGTGLARKCNAWDLYISHEGVSCANCGELIQEHKVIVPANEKETL